MYKQLGKPVQELTADSRKVVEEMLDLIKTRYPKAFKALCGLYTASELNRKVYEFNIVSRFVRCNFGEYDAHTPDIDTDGFFHFEEVKCPLRGECRMEGVICKPKLDSKLKPTLSSNLNEQAKDRIHRIGQHRPCSYYYLIADGSIEADIYNALSNYADFGEALFTKYLREYAKGDAV